MKVKSFVTRDHLEHLMSFKMLIGPLNSHLNGILLRCLSGPRESRAGVGVTFFTFSLSLRTGLVIVRSQRKESPAHTRWLRMLLISWIAARLYCIL